MHQYRKKPIVITAIQWKGNNWKEVDNNFPEMKWGKESGETIFIDSLEGRVFCEKGNWIIKGVAGEFYCCKDSIFNATYEKVEEQQCSEK